MARCSIEGVVRDNKFQELCRLDGNGKHNSHAQEGGGVSKVNIGSVTTASVTSRFTWMKFKMAPNG